MASSCLPRPPAGAEQHEAIAVQVRSQRVVPRHHDPHPDAELAAVDEHGVRDIRLCKHIRLGPLFPFRPGLLYSRGTLEERQTLGAR